MTRHSPVAALAVLSLLFVLGASPVLAGNQQPTSPDLPGELAAFWASKAGQKMIAEYTIPPTDAAKADPAGDGEFSTGETPGVDLPGELDIRHVRLGNLLLPDDFFKPIGDGGAFCDQGPGTELMPGVWTFCPAPYDPTAFADGGYALTFDMDAPVTLEIPETAKPGVSIEIVGWFHTTVDGVVFENRPQYPLDPAGGTNKARGLRVTTDGVEPFALDINSDGFFEQTPTNTVAAVMGSQLSLFIPKSEIGGIDELNAYTFRTDGAYTAADSVADQTGLFVPKMTTIELMPAPLPTTSSSSSSTSSTSTSTSSSVVSTPPGSGSDVQEAGPAEAVPTSGGGLGGWPWVVAGGVGLLAAGAWLAARSKDPCVEAEAAATEAEDRCRRARRAAKEAASERARAEAALAAFEGELEKLTDSMPPVGWDDAEAQSWIEEAGKPETRIDRFDLFARRTWARKLWERYREGEISASEVESGWDQPPPEEFRRDLEDAFKKAKEQKEVLDQKIEDAEAEAAAAAKADTAAQQAEAKACAEAAAARERHRRCVEAAAAARAKAKASAAATGTAGGQPSAQPGGVGTAGSASGADEAPPCSEGEEQLRSVTTTRVVVPIRLDPRVSGGAAHDAAEQAAEIGAVLGAGAEVAKAVGRLFSFKDGAKVVYDLTPGVAANLGAGAVSEAAEIPIPTDLPTAAANVAEVVFKAARAIITKTAKLQERRLPDVDLAVTLYAAPYILTCAEVWVCRQGTWQKTGKRLTIERGATMSLGSKKWTAVTWAEAQEELAAYAARVYRRKLSRALKEMVRFRSACGGT